METKHLNIESITLAGEMDFEFGTEEARSINLKENIQYREDRLENKFGKTIMNQINYIKRLHFPTVKKEPITFLDTYKKKITFLDKYQRTSLASLYIVPTLPNPEDRDRFS